MLKTHQLVSFLPHSTEQLIRKRLGSSLSYGLTA